MQQTAASHRLAAAMTAAAEGPTARPVTPPALARAVSISQKEDARQGMLADGTLQAVAKQFSQAVKVSPAHITS